MSEEYAKKYCDMYFKKFTVWEREDAHWTCDRDAAFQAWSYLHDTTIADLLFALKEVVKVADRETDEFIRARGLIAELEKKHE